MYLSFKLRIRSCISSFFHLSVHLVTPPCLLCPLQASTHHCAPFVVLSACGLARIPRKRHRHDQAEQYVEAAAKAMEMCGDDMPADCASYLTALVTAARADVAR